MKAFIRTFRRRRTICPLYGRRNANWLLHQSPAAPKILNLQPNFALSCQHTYQRFNLLNCGKLDASFACVKSIWLSCCSGYIRYIESVVFQVSSMWDQSISLLETNCIFHKSSPLISPLWVDTCSWWEQRASHFSTCSSWVFCTAVRDNFMHFS